MKPTVSIGAFGIRISTGRTDAKALEPSPEADQANPRGHYVYAHRDQSGEIFYVGRGVGRRAWDTSRHHLWHRYVENHLGGRYTVQILVDNLSADEVEFVEGEWITEHASRVVNWDNMAAPSDYKGNERANKLRDANRALVLEGRAAEARSLEEAASIYIRAIEAAAEYAFFEGHTGILRTLLDEYHAEVGYFGERAAIDRLSMCLVKLGRAKEAAEWADRYFEKYRGDLGHTEAERIRRRIAKAFGQS